MFDVLVRRFMRGQALRPIHHGALAVFPSTGRSVTDSATLADGFPGVWWMVGVEEESVVALRLIWGGR